MGDQALEWRVISTSRFSRGRACARRREAAGQRGHELRKDVSKGRPFKINVYQDPGSTTVDRVKVDANRNNKFDDKLTFKSNQITLEHAPADDENYTESYLWTGAGWTKQ